uniref:RRM domain-containing protein n=1 Tax=Neogobius melanostomus TaxID=47308 RepID=A0A8C6WTL0_9GOBI
MKPPRSITDWGKLFVGGLSCETKEDSLEEAFGQFGTVKKVNVVKDQHTGKSRGFGFIRYENVCRGLEIVI